MLERDVIKKIKSYLEANSYTIFKHYGSAYSVKGFPDLFGLTPSGQFIAIEVKVPGKKPSANQLTMIDYLQERGAISFWADSVEMVKEQLSTRQK